jgi:hypothetical protein
MFSDLDAIPDWDEGAKASALDDQPASRFDGNPFGSLIADDRSGFEKWTGRAKAHTTRTQPPADA